jgi:hypothetical protein
MLSADGEYHYRACTLQARYLYATLIAYMIGAMFLVFGGIVAADMHTWHLISVWLFLLPLAIVSLVHVLMCGFRPLYDSDELSLPDVNTSDRTTWRMAIATTLVTLACIATVMILYWSLWRVPLDRLREPGPSMTPRVLPSHAPDSSNGVAGGWIPQSASHSLTPFPTPSPTQTPLSEHHMARMKSVPSLVFFTSTFILAVSVWTNYRWRLERDRFNRMESDDNVHTY